jgi:hypothetical protein
MKMEAIMESSSFSELLNILSQQSSAHDKKTLVKATTTHNTFSCEQVAQMLNQIKYGKDQVQTLEILCPQISDLENTFQIMDVFTFAKDRKKASAILGQPEDVEAMLRARQVKESEQVVQEATMGESRFSDLLNALNNNQFPKEQLYLVEIAIFRNSFTTKQAVQILETFLFPRYQLRTLKVLRHRIIDPENHFLLVNAFSRGLQKKKAIDLLM